MKNIEFNELKEVVSKVYGINKIDKNTCINEQKVLSEDNDKFLNILENKYGVNMDGFNYYDYFVEDEFILLNLFRSLLSITGVRKNRKQKLNLDHILKVINYGRWFDPGSNEPN